MHTLILGAGGPVGGAWLGGLAATLLEAGVGLDDAEHVLGTSAGSLLGHVVGKGIR